MAVLLGGLPVLGQESVCTLGDGNWLKRVCFENIPSAPRYGHEVLGDTPEWDEKTLHPDLSTSTEMENLKLSLFKANLTKVHGSLFILSLLHLPFLQRPLTSARVTAGSPLLVSLISTAMAIWTLAKTLRVWTYRDGGLSEIASIKGVTNHSIGEPFITSSIRTCDGRPEMILNDARRKNILSVFFENGALTYKDLGAYTGPQSVLTPPAC